MFGLMKACACSQTAEQKHQRRMHYCGTCKTMGSLYGWKSRVLLNHDAVFLGEMLSALSNPDAKLWDRTYRSYNCFSLPEKLDDMPLPLQFAATAVVIIAQFKLEDFIMDSNRTLWRLPQALFSKSFKKASARLEEWEFPLSALRQCSHLQGEREAELSGSKTSRSADESLTYMAEPTATATGLFFQNGARIVGCHEAQQAMYELGHAFGTLVYLLDALEDYEKDLRAGEFNALQAAYKLSDHKLSSSHRDLVVQRLLKIERKIESAFEPLPISAAHKAYYPARLKANLSQRLSGGRSVVSRACKVSARPRMTFRLRSQAALQIGKALTRGHMAERPSLFSRLQTPFVFASALAVAFLFPRQAETVTTYRECVDLPLNLMLLGSLFKPAAQHQSPLPFGADLGDEILNGGEGTNEEGSGKKPKGTGCCGGCGNGDGGCCNSCDCCDCCCSCESCGSCNCCGDGCCCDCDG